MARKANNPQNLIPGANKNGRPKLSEIEKQANKISRQEIAEITILFKTKSYNEIVEIIDDPSTDILRAMRLKKAIANYKIDATELVESLDMRNIGAPKQRFDTSDDDDADISISDSVKSALKKLSD